MQRHCNVIATSLQRQRNDSATKNNPRAIVSASVFCECPVREDDNPILRGGGGLGEASGAGGATLR